MSKIMVNIRCITCNHESCISKAMEGFVSQITNFDFEVLVHDDALTDGTFDTVEEYEEKFPDLIRPIYQNNQYSKGAKIGQEYKSPCARGKYIVIYEGDDFWIDKYNLQNNLSLWKDFQSVVFVFIPIMLSMQKMEKVLKSLVSIK